MYPQLGQSLFPAFKERDFLIHWVSPPGTSAAEMERSTTRISQELLAIPGVQSAGAHIGQALLGEEVAGVNLGEIWVSLAPNADYTETLDRIHAVANGYPGLFREVQTYLDERIEEVLTGGKEPIVVRVYGEDLKTLRAKSDQILDLVKSVPGVHRRAPRHLLRRPAGRRDRQPGQGGEVRPQAGRRPPGRRDAGGRRGGRRHLPGRQGLRRRGLEPGADPAQRRRHREPADRPAVRRRTSGSGDVATVALQPNPNAIDRQGDSQVPRRGGDRGGP